MLRRHTAPCLLALLSLLPLVACDLFEDKPPSWSEAQIQPERGVSGIEIRMTSIEVANALGIIDRFGRTASVESVADDPQFYIDEIQRESYKRSLRIWWEKFPSEKISDFYINQVEGVNIDSYFEGKDSKGIGIGSGIEEVESAYGKYEGFISERGNSTMTYCVGRNVVRFFLGGNTVRGMYIGTFDPYHQGHVECTR